MGLCCFLFNIGVVSAATTFALSLADRDDGSCFPIPSIVSPLPNYYVETCLHLYHISLFSFWPLAHKIILLIHLLLFFFSWMKKKRRNKVCIREEVVERESFALATMMIKMVVLASICFYSRMEDVKEKKYIIWNPTSLIVFWVFFIWETYFILFLIIFMGFD